MEVHNNSKSNPVDEASPGVTANMFIRNGRWGEEPNFLSSLEPEWEDCTQEYAIRQNLSLPLGLLTKKQHLFQEKTATSSVFDKCFLGSLKIRIPSFAAGAPEMVPPKEKTHYWRNGYCRWWINAQEYTGDWSNHGLLFLGKNVFLRHFKVKIKTITLEQPITKLWLLESVGHWKWFAYFSELFKRLCATFIELSWCSIKLDIQACLRHLGFCDIYCLSNLLFEQFII